MRSYQLSQGWNRGWWRLRRLRLRLRLWQCLFLSAIVCFLISCYTVPASAHGATIDVMTSQVAIRASFDTGEPMAEAQVLIYSPESAETPWQTGETDSDGQFAFAPDPDISGLWEVTVRKAGHGHTTTFESGELSRQPSAGFADGFSRGPNSGSSRSALAQRWVTMAAVVWGFVGTALFFSRQQKGGTP